MLPYMLKNSNKQQEKESKRGSLNLSQDIPEAPSFFCRRSKAPLGGEVPFDQREFSFFLIRKMPMIAEQRATDS